MGFIFLFMKTCLQVLVNSYVFSENKKIIYNIIFSLLTDNTDHHFSLQDARKITLAKLFLVKVFFNYDFSKEFHRILKKCEEYGRKIADQPRKMRTFDESLKSKKTVASMIENKNEIKPKGKENKHSGSKVDVQKSIDVEANCEKENGTIDKNDAVLRLQSKFQSRQSKGKKVENKKSPAAKPSKQDKSKKPRIWDCSGSSKEVSTLDFSKKGDDSSEMNGHEVSEEAFCDKMEVGRYRGNVKRIETSESEEESEDEVQNTKKEQSKSYGMFSMFKGLVGQKNVTRENMQPILDKLKDHMIAKNVAADIADKLCESVANKLEGKILGTFTGITSTVKSTLIDALVQLLSPAVTTFSSSPQANNPFL